MSSITHLHSRIEAGSTVARVGQKPFEWEIVFIALASCVVAAFMVVGAVDVARSAWAYLGNLNF